MYVEMPHFRHPVVFEERPYALEGGGTRRLNDTWTEHVDAHTGQKHYINLRTQEILWRLPAEFQPRSLGGSGRSGGGGPSGQGEGGDGAGGNGSGGAVASGAGGGRQDKSGRDVKMGGKSGAGSGGGAMAAQQWTQRFTVIEDPELDQENPIHVKYNKIARGVFDPTLKPNKAEKERIQRIISSQKRKDEMEPEDMRLLLR